MAAKRRAFILRIWQTDDGLRGQISDPQAGWRRPFQNAAELWRVLVEQAAQAPPTNESSDFLSTSDFKPEEER